MPARRSRPPRRSAVVDLADTAIWPDMLAIPLLLMIVYRDADGRLRFDEAAERRILAALDKGKR